MMLLPWEKIPIFIWGPILATIMIFLSLKADPFTQEQAAFVGFAVLGVAAFIFDTRKRYFSSKARDSTTP